MSELEQTFPILRFFRFSHLPPALQELSAPFSDLAYTVAARGLTSDRAETTVALRKLLEAKDAAVRAGVPR